MRKPYLIASLISVAAIAGGAAFVAQAKVTPVSQPAKVDLVAGEALYQENCAACHGVDLEGQPNWQSGDENGRPLAPPHDRTGHTWHHGDTLLFNYTTLGGKAALELQGVDFDSAMPGFAELMTEQQIWDTLAFIKSTWPERMKEVQASRSEIELLRGDK